MRRVINEAGIWPPSCIRSSTPPNHQDQAALRCSHSFRGRSRAGTLGTGRPLLMRRAGRLPRNRQSGDGGREPAIAGMALSPCALFSQAPRRTNGHQLDGTSHCTRPHRGTVTVSPPDNPTSAGIEQDWNGRGRENFKTRCLKHFARKLPFALCKSKYPNQLSDRQPIISRADLGAGGIYYRALMGPFASAEKAAKLCSD